MKEAPPTREDVLAGEPQGATKRGRRPKADQGIIDNVTALLNADPYLPSAEVLKRSKDWNYQGGRSQMFALVKKLRPKPTMEPIVRFEGLPGEYTQFDFGECQVTFRDGESRRVVFFAARLKYSRYMHVELVPDQKAETLVRAILASLKVFGGSTKEWVFDNPKTVRISPIGVTPVVLHRFLRQLVAEHRVIATLCAPRSGNQKGSVERLVGFVKNSFLLVRHFTDYEDLRVELGKWLHEVNVERPSDATGVRPAVARERELPWLQKRPPSATPDAWAIVETATVRPTGTVSYKGTEYFATTRYLGAAATLLVRRGSVEVHVGADKCTHPRLDGTGEVRRLPEQRETVVAALRGHRKVATFRRQCLLELGPVAEAFLTPLVHVCEDWEGPCHELYDLLLEHGDGAMVDAMTRCVARRTFNVPAIRRVLREAA